MTTRTSLGGNGMPGGRIEYRGDLTPPTQTYASSLGISSIGSNLRVPATTVQSGSPVVRLRQRRGGIMSFLRLGAVMMRTPIPARDGYGNVQRSPFQRWSQQNIPWQINPSWNEAGYPQNLGLSFRSPQIRTKVTGGPTDARMRPAPLFTRVQVVPRATAQTRTYPTRGQ